MTHKEAKEGATKNEPDLATEAMNALFAYGLQPFGDDDRPLHCTHAAALSVWDYYLGEKLKRGDRPDWDSVRARVVPGAEGFVLFGHPLVIHADGPANFWLETGESEGIENR